MAAKDELDRYKTLVSNLENELKSKGKISPVPSSLYILQLGLSHFITEEKPFLSTLSLAMKTPFITVQVNEENTANYM